MKKRASFLNCFNSVFVITGLVLLISCKSKLPSSGDFHPSFSLIPSGKFYFNSFVDCNMAEVWIGDTFRIFPGKYGEDPLWGNSMDLKYANGRNADEAFGSKAGSFFLPEMPLDAAPHDSGLHGAVWFETIYQDKKNESGNTLYAIYHNENYPSTIPWNANTGKGYKNENWPEGLKGPNSDAAVCRIGIMKSTNGGRSWENKGLFIEDLQSRLILKPHNTSKTFAGGTGDPSAVASGNYLYLFYGEYGYPGIYSERNYNAATEQSGQCISIARIAITDLDKPSGKAKRWNGNSFAAPYDSIGSPIKSLQISKEQGGGPASSPAGGYYWGPSVSWNDYLKCWVMLMAKAVGPSWAGSSIYISFNRNIDLSEGKNSQEWSTPLLLLDKPGYFLWYPSLQPLNTLKDIADRNTCMKLGQKARLFLKYIKPEKSEYLSEFIIEFNK